MLYQLLKIPARLALYFYCRHISISKKELLAVKGPLLIAANHPNAFLDAIIITTLFKRPIHSLARGDAFKNKFISALLGSLNMLPVYRKSEGPQNLESNYSTFDTCKKIFKKNGIVLMFSEGNSENEWKLRPLMKGTARLAINSWEEGIPLKILPTGINYNSFTSFGKNVQINFGNIIEEKEVDNATAFGQKVNAVNKKIETELKNLVITSPPALLPYLTDTGGQRKKGRSLFYIKQSPLKKICLFLPALSGYLLHYILYTPVQKFACRKARPFGFYDSVLVGMLVIIYPFYLLMIAVILFLLTGTRWSLLVFILLPFCAWSYVQLKKQI